MEDERDVPEIPEVTDFTGAIRNPFYESRMKHGYRTCEHCDGYAVVTEYAPNKGGVVKRYIVRDGVDEELLLPNAANG